MSIFLQRNVNLKWAPDRFSLSLFIVFILSGLSVQAQEQVVVKGTVKDESGQNMPGVNVVLKGTLSGTVTDANGMYSIILPSGVEDLVLVFSFIGYHSQEIRLNGQTTLDIGLQPSVEALGEVVVVGYGTQKKTELTGAVSSISAQEIMQSGAISVDQALQGRIAGLQMTQNTGIPGGGTSIQIRGLGSVNSSNEPIYIIDGVIIDAQTGVYTQNAISSLNPNDVESIDVLKDASATAIYGARGANGVIIITTKRGKEGKPRVTFDAKYSRQYLPKYLDMANLPQYAQHANELYTVNGWNLDPQFANPSALSEGVNWQKEIFRPAAMGSYNLSFSGGSNNTTYKVSAGYLDQDGIAAGSGFKRLTVNTAIDSHVNSWIDAGGVFYLSKTDQEVTISDWNLINSAVKTAPYVPVRNLDGSFGGPSEDDLLNRDSFSNPLALAELIDKGNTNTGVRGNLYLAVKPLKGLEIKTEFSANADVRRTHTFVPEYELGYDFNATVENTKQINYSQFWAWRNIATYKKSFAEKHSVTLMAAQEMTESSGEYLMGYRQGGDNELQDLSSGDANYDENGGTSYRTAYLSYFGRLIYSYNDRYILTSTIRRDGSSNFADGYRWGVFPSFALAWRVSEEQFLQGFDPISNLKVRVGYGEVGNSNISAFAYSANLSSVSTIWGTGYLVGNMPNESLTWETTNSYNVGVDLGFLNNRIELTGDVYLKTTDDLLLKSVLPRYTGSGDGQGQAEAGWGNVGSIENKGIELSLNTMIVNKNDFRWRSNVVFTLNKNKLLRMNTESAEIIREYDISGKTYQLTKTRVGESIGQFFGYKLIGRINSAEDLYDSEGNVKIAIPENQPIDRETGIWVGDFIWEDYNQDGVINEEDRQNLGSPLPKFTYGFGNTFSYKNFDLNLYFVGSYGNKVLNLLRLEIDNPNSRSNITEKAATNYARLELLDSGGDDDDIYNYYVASGADDMPRMSKNDANGNSSYLSDRFLENGSYLRLQNVSLSYSAPQSLLSKLKVSNLKIILSAQNVFTITNYSGYDPEVGMMKTQYTNYGQDPFLNGIDVGRYPTPRIYSINLTLGL